MLLPQLCPPSAGAAWRRVARPLQRDHLPISPSAVLVQNAEGLGVYNLLVTPSFHLRWLWFQGGGVDLLKDTNLGILTRLDA